MAINKRKILQSAQKHQQKGALDKALKDYQTVLKADPKDSNVRLKVGDIHLKQGKRDEAVTAYLKVAEQFMRDGFDAKAVALYKQITKIDPDRLEVHAPLAELYERLGLARDALRALQTAADAHYREGRKKEALDLLRRMAALDPSNTVNRLKVAELLRQEERTDEALDEYEATAGELERRGEGEERARVLEKIVEIDPQRGNALEELARAYAAQHRFAEAEPLARRCTQAAPDAPGGWELLGEALRALGREGEAPEAYRKLADIYRQRGDEDRARDIMQRYVSTGSLGGETSEPVLETDDELVPDTGLAGAGEEGRDAFEEGGTLDLGAEAAPLPDMSQGGAGEEDPNAATVSQLPPLGETGGAAPGPQAMPGSPPPPEAGAEPAPADGASAGAGEGDLDQYLAEANVYLRYGKHDRAVESLRAALRIDPRHRGALESLGEALEKGGDPANAAEALRRAGQRAQEEGDAEGVAQIRARLEPLDPDAARALTAPEAQSTASPEAPSADFPEMRPKGKPETRSDPRPAASAAAEAPASPAPSAREAPAGGAAGHEDGLDGGDIDIEIDSGVEGSEGPAASPDAGAADDGPLELGADEEEIDVSDLVEADEPADADGTPAPASAERGQSASSSTTPQQIVEELEEADFYFQQSLYDEAEAIYRRVLQAAPSHPQAHLRLGEIEAARGGPAASEAAPAPAARGEGAASSEAQRPSSEGTDSLPELGGLDGDSSWEEELSLEEETSELAADDAQPQAEAAAREPERPPKAGARPAEPGPEPPSPPRRGAMPQAEITEPSVGDTTEPFSAEGEESGEGVSIDLEEESEAGAAPDTSGVAEPEPEQAGAFDLAAELSGAFEDDDTASNLRSLSGAPAGTTEEEGFEQVFAAFKQGVSKELGASDHEAHYDLGIAYREMGLLEDAVGEFRQASEGESRRLPALHMMGLCALDLGRAPDAAAHLEQALALPDVPEEQRAPLHFDLGRAREETGELERARHAYEAVAAIDPEFQQVQQRLDALARREAAGGGSDADPDETETLESFDDLLAETEAEPEAAYESFDDLLEEDEEPEGTAELEAEPDEEGGGEGSEPSDSGPGGSGRGGRPRRRKISFV